MAFALMFVGLPALGFTPLGDPFGLAKVEAQAADGVSDDVFFYAGTDLDPNAKQKLDAFRFLTTFPAFGDAWREEFGADPTDSTDVRKVVFERALAETGCEMSYDADVAPWLGSRMALSGVLNGQEEPFLYASVEVTDRDAASAAIDTLAQCGDPSDTAAYAFAGDYLIVTGGSDAQSRVDGYAQQVESGSLADSADFRNDIDQLGDLGVGTFWADLSGVYPLMEEEGTDVGAASEQAQRIAGTMRFSSDSAELATVAYGSSGISGVPDNEVGSLPDSTAFALSVAGGSQYVEHGWPSIEEMAALEGTDVQGSLDELEQETGLRLPDDLQTLFGDGLTLSVDGESDWQHAVQMGDWTAVDAAVDLSGDKDALNDLMGRLLRLAGADPTQLPVARRDTDDGMVIASNQDYAEKVAAGDGDLAGDAEFSSVIADPEQQDFVAYLNVNAIEDPLVQSLVADGSLSESDAENLRAVKAIGMSADTEGDYVSASVKMSLD